MVFLDFECISLLSCFVGAVYLVNANEGEFVFCRNHCTVLTFLDGFDYASVSVMELLMCLAGSQESGSVDGLFDDGGDGDGLEL